MVYMSFQLWIEFGSKLLYQVNALPVNEFGKNLDFKNLELAASLHWQINLAMCSRTNIIP
jgi:hypothetical protein